jgi:hypothetical protein
VQDQQIMEAIYRSAAANHPVELERVEMLDAFRDPRISLT